MENKVSSKKSSSGFSLIELLTAMTILAVVMLLMSELLNQVQRTWRFGEDRISQFREARVAFDLITKNLSQASMNTYWDYEYDSDGFVTDYKKKTELHFVTMEADKIASAASPIGEPSGHAIFFQAPLGDSLQFRNLNNLFNGRGYMVLYGSDRDFRPKIMDQLEFPIPYKYRFRLMEFRPPAEDNQVFQDAIDELEESSTGPAEQVFNDWWNQGLGIGGAFSEYLNPLAENIILLVVTPMDTLEALVDNRYDTSSRIAPDYSFDSNKPDVAGTGQMVPPLVKVTMVAIDESTAVQLETNGSSAEVMPDIVPDSLFRQTSKYTEDTTELIEYFNEYNREDNGVTINYRIFSTVVMLRASKWVVDEL